MIGASLYITACSLRNRLRRWGGRLREPRYLVGAVAAGAYFYFAVFARRRGGAGWSPDVLHSLQPDGGAMVGLWTLVMAAGAWVFPYDGGLLDFSPAETNLLFPAPVSRRQLLFYRLLRSQVGLLLAGVIPALLVPLRAGSETARVRIAIAIWLLVVTGKLYSTGVTLARTRGLRRAWVAPTLVASVVAVVGVSVWRAVASHPYSGFGSLVGDITAGVTAVPASLALAPLTALAAPLFASTTGGFFAALAGAILVLGATFLWVLRADEALQDAAAAAALRRERGRSRAGATRAGQGPWTLASTGHTEMVFAWKAAVQTSRVVERRTVLRVIALAAGLGAFAVGASQSRGPAAVLALVGLGGAAYVVLLAPQILRIDLRQDLLQLEWLKTWPVRPAALIRGELIWPGVVLTALAWLLLGMGFALSGSVLGSMPLGVRASGAAGVAVLVPALVSAQLTIHNAVVLAFPGWATLGRHRARGFDAIGQRLITLGGTWFALIIALVPAAAAGAIVWFAFSRLVGAVAIIPGACAAAAVIAIEVALATEALGPLFERLDVTSVEGAE